LFLCLYNSTIVFGQALVAYVRLIIDQEYQLTYCRFIAQGAVKIDGKWSYGTIILLQMMFPAVGFAGWYFFAESPYWLIQQDRTEDARKQLTKLYTPKHADFVEFELERLREEARFAAELRSAANLGGPAIWQVWKGGNQIRTFTAVFISAGQQLMGASFVLGYLTYFLQLIHVKDAFSVSAGLFVVMLCSTTAAFPLIEVFGRRKILIVPCYLLVFILLIIGIMGCIPNKTAAGYVSTAFEPQLYHYPWLTVLTGHHDVHLLVGRHLPVLPRCHRFRGGIRDRHAPSPSPDPRLHCGYGCLLRLADRLCRSIHVSLALFDEIPLRGTDTSAGSTHGPTVPTWEAKSALSSSAWAPSSLSP
jgi:hypothetical protein